MASRASSTALRRTRLIATAAAVAVVSGLALPATGGTGTDLAAYTDYGFQGEGEARVRDVDRRAGAVAASAEQEAIAARLGATSPRWNAFGTPHVLFNHDGTLSGPREGAAVDVARAFVRENAALFRLSAQGVDSLEVLRDSPLHDAPDLARVYRDKAAPANPDVAHVVLFRQRFGDLTAAADGLLTVGVQADGSVTWVSSSITGDTAVTGEQRLDAVRAIRQAASDASFDVGELTQVAAPGARFLTFDASGAKDVQRARLVALPTAQDGLRRAWEVTLLDTELDEFGNPTAFISFVDAETGRVWRRENRVDHFASGIGARQQAAPPSGSPFSGQTKPQACGDRHEFEVGPGNGQISVAVAATDPTVDDDITINLYRKGNPRPVAAADLLTSPEVLTYRPGGEVPAGTYQVEICPYTASNPDAVPYSGLFAAHPGAGGGENGSVQLPEWRVFPANPPFVTDADTSNDSTDTRVLWCWDNDTNTRTDSRPGFCQEQQRNTASRVPWDVNAPSSPSFTTDGNNASTAISEASFLTPDTAANRPFALDRRYDFPWQNSWFESKCDPTNFGTVVDDRNDEAASTANLFVQHNRMHDWSYFLGFTEVNYNLQKTNFGNTGPERENDPELGSSQAGRRTFNGRDNANQITLQDGIAPITNQYLWQPLAGAFYSPCVDGAYDQAVVAHEYGHAITNRMLGGPDGGTGATQGQTESWSDLIFAAYFTEFGISAGPGVNPYVLGPYVTGDPVSGIRNYPMNASPLNYSDLDYDGNGLASPHANGEIWSATNFDILRSLVAKYDQQFPSTDKALQVRCAKGDLPSDRCPGNRRWNQIQFDSFLLQPSGVTMIDSRDAMLAADRLRFGGANQRELWDAFAKRGLGQSAKSTGPADVQAAGGWDSPLRADEGVLTFSAPAGVSKMQVFVGRYEARATPAADTDGATATPASLTMVPGTYEFVARADGFGLQRFEVTVTARERRTVAVPMRRNLASLASGAKATGDGVNLDKLIDDTEATNWASLTSEGTASAGKGEGRQVEGRQVTIDLAGTAPVRVAEVQVSAALRGPIVAEEDEELPSDPDPNTQSRFSALRSFDVLACNSATGADCSKDASYKKIFASKDDAFPSRRPRPKVPDLIIRPFAVTPTDATHLRLVVRDSQCTGGPDFQGETNEDNDPAFNPDCDTEAPSPDRAALRPPVQLVRAAEFQAFSAPASAPAGGSTTKPPATTTPGGTSPSGGTSPAGGSGGSGGSGSGGSGSGGSASGEIRPAAGQLPATGGVPVAAAIGAGLLIAAGVGVRRARAGLAG